MRKILLFLFSFALGYGAHEIQYQTVALAQSSNSAVIRTASLCQRVGNSSDWTCDESFPAQTIVTVPGHVSQETITLVPQVSQEPTRPPLTVRELIEVMADFDIRHALAVPGQDWYGMTEFENRRITMESDMDLTQRRRVAIHEAWHIALRLRGDDAYGDEVLIAKLVDSEYKRMFGSAQ